MRKIHAFAAIAALTLAGAAQAGAGDTDQDSNNPSLNMSKVDKNADGRISRAEAASGDPRLADKFDSVDANRDGTLSAAEFARYEGQGAAPDSPSQQDGDPALGTVKPAPRR